MYQSFPGAGGNTPIGGMASFAGYMKATLRWAPDKDVYASTDKCGFTQGLEGRTLANGDLRKASNQDAGWGYRSTYPMYYYNFSKKQFEGIGQGKSFFHASNKWRNANNDGDPLYTAAAAGAQSQTLLQDLCIGFNGNVSRKIGSDNDTIENVLSNNFGGAPISTLSLIHI